MYNQKTLTHEKNSQISSKKSLQQLHLILNRLQVKLIKRPFLLNELIDIHFGVFH